MTPPSLFGPMTLIQHFLAALSATQYISLSVCVFVCPSVTVFQIQAIILSLLAYSILLKFNKYSKEDYLAKSNKASNWQIVAQIKLFSDLCDRICLYRQNYTRLAYTYLSSWGNFKQI